MNCMLCTAINKGNLSKREKERALEDVLNVDEMDTEPQTAEVPPLREKASQKETVNLKERVKGKERVNKAEKVGSMIHQLVALVTNGNPTLPPRHGKAQKRSSIPRDIIGVGRVASRDGRIKVHGGPSDYPKKPVITTIRLKRCVIVL